MGASSHSEGRSWGGGGTSVRAQNFLERKLGFAGAPGMSDIHFAPRTLAVPGPYTV